MTEIGFRIVQIPVRVSEGFTRDLIELVREWSEVCDKGLCGVCKNTLYLSYPSDTEIHRTKDYGPHDAVGLPIKTGPYWEYV